MVTSSEVIKMIINRFPGTGTKILEIRPVGGGCINFSSKVVTDRGTYFIKWNHARKYPGMFEAEKRGMELLAAANALRVPAVYHSGSDRDHAWIIMEWIESGRQRADFWTLFGKGLALLHRHHADRFGLDHDNYIGSLPQRNTWEKSWIDFFVQQRLEPMIIMAKNQGYLQRRHLTAFERLFARLPEIFPDEPPALLHGDLWSGNFLTGEDGLPVLIDPAVYYGNREMEISFTRLFGGFAPEFYRSYNETYPLQPGFQERIDICNLYPLLVHVNLFGAGYMSGIESTLNRFL